MSWAADQIAKVGKLPRNVGAILCSDEDRGWRVLVVPCLARRGALWACRGDDGTVDIIECTSGLRVASVETLGHAECVMTMLEGVELSRSEVDRALKEGVAA